MMGWFHHWLRARGAESKPSIARDECGLEGVKIWSVRMQAVLHSQFLVVVGRALHREQRGSLGLAEQPGLARGGTARLSQVSKSVSSGGGEEGVCCFGAPSQGRSRGNGLKL
jgi:hypothetical protein